LLTVALIGADGAGKTTVGRRLQEELPELIKYVYMGVNLDSSNLVLPTTRLLLEIKRVLGKRPVMSGPPDPTRTASRPQGLIKRTIVGLKSSLRLVNQLGEEWFRQAVAWHYRRRGYVVLFDRHFFFDYYAHDIANRGQYRPLSSQIHGFLLKHFYPQPDLVVFLDAPAEVLFARKGEGTIYFLEHRRQEYLQLRHHVRHFFVVDVTRPLDDVTRDVIALIQGFRQARSDGPCEVQDGRS
jgi:thymidylate kinase